MVDFGDQFVVGPHHNPTPDTLAEVARDFPDATPTGIGLALEQLKRFSAGKMKELLAGREVTWQTLAPAILGHIHDNGPEAKIDPQALVTIVGNAAYGVSEESMSQGNQLIAALAHPWVGIFNTEVNRVTDTNGGKPKTEISYRLKPDLGSRTSYTQSMQKLRSMEATGYLPVTFPPAAK